MAAVVSAAMFAAGARTAVTMLVIMMAAAYVCVVNQLLGKISSYGFICSTGDAAQKFNAGVTQGGLSSAADAAADKGIDAVLHKDAGQQTVAASVGVDDFCVRQLLCIFLQTVGRSGFGDDARGASGNEDEAHTHQRQHRQRIVENDDA